MTMHSPTENLVEDVAAVYFGSLNYVVKRGVEIDDAGERASASQLVLTNRLIAAVHRLNPELPNEQCEQVARTLTRPPHPTLIQNNRWFHNLLTDGVEVEYRDATTGETRGGRARLINFEQPEKNDLLVVRQLTVVGPTGKAIRPDLTVFLNGLPIALIELKDPTDTEADLGVAIDQLDRYMSADRGALDFFVPNLLLAVSDGLLTRVGSITSGRSRFMPWRPSEGGKPSLEALIRGLFAPALLLDYLRTCVTFEEDARGEVAKKIAGYHQFRAIRKARASVVSHLKPGGDGRGGVVWHTQGSGKSLTMLMLAGGLVRDPALANPTIVMVTDRNDLDDQLFGTFAAGRALLRQDPVQAESREQLRQVLDRAAGGVVFTTIHKFAEAHGEISTRNNIVVMADEAHRTQYGFEAKLKTPKSAPRASSALTTGDGQPPEHRAEFASAAKYQVGYAQHLRDALPNATFVAFTGTPVSGEDRDTRAVFGDYISVYDMQQAKEDGATVAIYYESRLARLGLKADEMATIDDEVDELAEDEEESQQAKLKSRWAALEKVVGAAPRVAQVAADLVAHFEERNKAQTGKAMVVAMSREICVHLYDEIIKLRPDWHSPDPEQGAIKIVMTGSASDKALLRPHIYSAQVKKRLEKRFKNPADPLRLVIVRDMWLTGFDAPCVHTLYVDKPMKGHNLMQAIARVNRVFKDKQGGLVVDYIGIANELKSALKEYTAAQGRGRPTVDAHEAWSVLAEKLDALRGMLAGTNHTTSGHGFDYSDFLTGGHKTLAGAANYVLGLKDGKRRFADLALAMSKAFTLCCTLDEAKAVREEVAFFQAVKVLLTKRDVSAARKTDEERELAIRQIISSAVVSDEVVDIFDAVGLDKPDIGILDDAFLAEVRNLPERNLAVELLERLLEGEIRSRFAGNVVQSRKFSDMLSDVVQRYQNRSIAAAQVMEELVQMARKFREAASRGEQLGLNEDEVRFYDALAQNESAVRELADETLKKIAHELAENLRRNLTVDWSARESVQARLRLMVKRILRKYSYPPDGQDEAVALVLLQARTMAAGVS